MRKLRFRQGKREDATADANQSNPYMSPSQETQKPYSKNGIATLNPTPTNM